MILLLLSNIVMLNLFILQIMVPSVFDLSPADIWLQHFIWLQQMDILTL